LNLIRQAPIVVKTGMADFAKVSLILRRLLATLALAILLASVTACFDQGTAGVLFLPTWAALFFGWQCLSRKLNFNINISKAPRPRPRRSTAWGRVIVTGLVASGIAFGIALFPVADFSAIAGPLIWIALYYGWPAMSRRLPLPESWKVKAQSDIAAPAPKPTFWRLLGRGALAMFGIVTVMILLTWMVTAPIAHSMRRARKVHDSIRVGMTMPEVVDASRDCDLFGVTSESVSDVSAAGDTVPAMSFSRNRDGSYQVDGVALTETQAAERLQTNLHDRYRWRSNCVYVNMTPMHVSFSVIFRPDGRVGEVTPVHGWD
jgi:hypothetical protein